MVASIEQHIACINEESTCQKGGANENKTGSNVKPHDSNPPDNKNGESSFWDTLGNTVSDGWNQTKKVAGDAWGRIKQEVKEETESLKGTSFKERMKKSIQWSLEWIPGISGISTDIKKLTGFNLIEWISENPGSTLLNAAGIALIFVPGGQGAGAATFINIARTLGWGIVGGSGVGGIVAGLTGGDISDGILYGGLAGLVGGGVGGGVYRGAASFFSRYGGSLVQKWLPGSLGGGSGAFADMATFEWLTQGKVDWKKAGLTGAMIGALTFGGGMFLDKAGPAIGQAMKQFGFNVNIGADGTIAMPWVREAEENVRKSSGSGGTQTPFKARKPPKLSQGDPNFSFKSEWDEKTKELWVTTSDGRKFKVNYGEKRNTVETKTTKEGNTYTVSYDGDAFPDFSPYAVKSKNGEPIEIILPDDTLVGPSSDQTRYTTQLLKEKYPNWRTEFGFTESQIASIEKNKGSIGPGIFKNSAEQLTWHHDKETGKLILVPYDLNNTFQHSGGHQFWGSQK
ncbi:hypothetical protein GXN76_08245 [Kroppenstedtia pulmonis]|uniref:HNH endonuclease n=1 Tax=Kroppenstedtia pulmonis TaxID=1380685 RepID=A0A7D3Y4X3_9BACL|nr:HNH endonuclease [Kroppenstedtia pulmonis]QKG84465.1 hypothetical protein GXN76_08245 [Kroppenstedtia pulmonis]